MAKIKNQEIAEFFCDDERHKKNMIYLREYDMFYRWENGWYKEIPSFNMSRLVYRFIKSKFGNVNINRNIVSDIILQIKWSILREVENHNAGYFALRDVIYNLKSFETEPVDLEKIIIYFLDYPAEDLKGTPTTFLKFLETSLVIKDTVLPDFDLIDFVQEMFGFFLLDSMKGAGAFFLVGDGSNGKSVMANLIQKMIGEQFCSAMSIQTMTTNNFAVQHLVGKKVNVSNEEESKYMKSDKFKALITGERISAERKFGDNFEFTPTTKYIFASNELPTFDNINYGLMRRIKIIPFFRRFSDKDQDKDLDYKLEREMPAIIGWALEGAKRFVANHYVFSTPSSSIDAGKEFESQISSAIRFVSDNYEVDDSAFISNDELYAKYRTWCGDNGKKPVNSFKFHNDTTKNIPKLKTKATSSGSISYRGKNLAPKYDEPDDYDHVVDPTPTKEESQLAL